MEKRGFRDRDFLSTTEGFLFCVVGPYHPADRVIGYLKYLPDPKGTWRRGREGFKRVMQTYTIANLLETFDFLRAEYPKYLFFSEVYGIAMTAVPRESIVSHFKPEKKLATLFQKSRLDSLQRRVVRFVDSLSQLSGASAGKFGVTGSILLDIHNPAFSDMDVTVYGEDSSYAVKEALAEVGLAEEFGIRRFDEGRLGKWLESRTQNHPLSHDEARRVYERKWNVGVFEGTLFSAHPVRLEGELKEKYGDKTCRPLGMVGLRAVVSDSRDSIFLPAVYGVSEVELEGEVEARVEEVVSYEGLYDSLAEEGEAVEVWGKLEHVVDSRTGREYDRVLVGSPEGRGREYIKPV